MQRMKILKQLFPWLSSRGPLWEIQKEKKSLQAIICFFFSFNVTDVMMPALDEAVLLSGVLLVINLDY